MNTILVPTDYSQDAHNALLFAIQIARQTGARIILFHAFYQPLSFPLWKEFTSVVNELEKSKAERLEAYAADVRAALAGDFRLCFQNPGAAGKEPQMPLYTRSGFHTVALDETPAKLAEVRVRSVCKFGVAFDEILKAIEVHRADLVVMGMRGEGAFSKAFLGRTTINVMREAQVPVLAVPEKASFSGFRSVVFAADLFKLPTHAVLNTLGDFVKTFHSRLQVLHLYRKNSLEEEQEHALSALDILDRQLSDTSYSVVFQQEHDVAEGVQEFVRKQHADLLVLIPQKHTFLESLLSQSLTHTMVAKATVPLLSLPAGVASRAQEQERPELEKVTT